MQRGQYVGHKIHHRLMRLYEFGVQLVPKVLHNETRNILLLDLSSGMAIRVIVGSHFSYFYLSMSQMPEGSEKVP